MRKCSPAAACAWQWLLLLLLLRRLWLQQACRHGGLRLADATTRQRRLCLLQQLIGQALRPGCLPGCQAHHMRPREQVTALKLASSNCCLMSSASATQNSTLSTPAAAACALQAAGTAAVGVREAGGATVEA